MKFKQKKIYLLIKYSGIFVLVHVHLCVILVIVIGHDYGEVDIKLKDLFLK